MKRSTPNYLSRIVEAANRTAPAARPPAMASPGLPDTLPHESFPLEIHDAQPLIQKPADRATESVSLPQRTHASPHPVIPITPAGTLVARQIRDRHSAAKTTGTHGGSADLPRFDKTFSPPAASAAASHSSKPATPTTSVAAKGTNHSRRAPEILPAPPVESNVSVEATPRKAPLKRPLSSGSAKVREKVETETPISLSAVEVPSGAGILQSANEQSERFERPSSAFLEQRRAPVQEKKISVDLPGPSEARTAAVWPGAAANIPAPRLNPAQTEDNRVTIGAIEVQVNNHPAPVSRPAAPSKAAPSFSDALETRYLNRFQLKL